MPGLVEVVRLVRELTARYPHAMLPNEIRETARTGRLLSIRKF